MSEIWSVTIKTLVVFTVVIGVLLISSCGTRNCNTQEFLTNSMCR